MDIIGLLSSVNKIGLIAFIITLVFLVYEINQLKKSEKTPRDPAVPQFHEGIGGNFVPQQTQAFSQTNSSPFLNNMNLILVSAILLFIFGGLMIFGLLRTKSAKQQSLQKVPVIPTASPSPTVVRPSPTSVAIVASPTQTVTPSQVVTLSVSQSPTPNLPTSTPTVKTVSPTVITRLPDTGYIQNILVFISAGAIAVFFAFLF